MNSWSTRTLAGTVCLWLAACSSVPKETVELSMAVGEGITGMQVSHEAFVQEYYRLSKQRVEDFLANRWVPEFMETFVRDAELMRLLDHPEPLPPDDVDRIREELATLDRISAEREEEIVLAVLRALGDADRGALVVEFAEAAVGAIERQRAELLGPIAAQEAKALIELRAAYTELRGMQDAITAQLQSVHDVQVEQDEILARLGALEARDRAVQAAVELNDRIVELLAKGQDAEATVNEIRELIESQR